MNTLCLCYERAAVGFDQSVRENRGYWKKPLSALSDAENSSEGFRGYDRR